MSKKVYISRLSSFLPNAPVDNDDMENILGYVGGHPSRIKKIILRQNQIKQRHYAMREGNLTHTNAELMVNAINGLFDNEFDANAIELLACGTSTPDQLIPSHASMVHGLLQESNPIPLLSVSGVCCSAIQALEFAFLSVLSGHTNNAVCGGSELVSPLLRSDMFEEEYRTINQIQENPYIAFEKDFLRWMLSDGAGCALLTDRPMGRMSLEIKWIESVSYANVLDVCMSQGLFESQDGTRQTWKQISPHDWQKHSIFSIRQDVKILSEHVAEKAVEHIYNSCKKHNFSFTDVDYFLPHLSSMFFWKKLEDKLKEKGLLLDTEKWFTNLTRVGNIGSASIYVMLDELCRTRQLHNGELIYLIVPESARFSYTTVLLEVSLNDNYPYSSL
ncbi:StlD/DarB family beta-ketosynthase [uncultured Bacteroides sp.]|uniref:StlD/DarB family beta-ketosynthase n=1 Tax=uncultured Bacteroides sp. TaxID=162156 RepID=UPI0032B2E761